MINKLQILLVLFLLIFGGLHLFARSQNIAIRDIFLPGTPILHIGEMPLRVVIANTSEERAKGLSHRDTFEGADGMLFVFSETDYHRIWMKDMRFPIDIIWIGEDLKVINIQKNVHPDTYPNVFKPDQPARYAVETNVHYSDTFGLRTGHEVRLPGNYLED